MSADITVLGTVSADITDLTRIQDEDVLKKMWQETEDFGKKKEIRSHMYKLRETRLKDFYNSADVNSEVRRTSTTENIAKSKLSTTHADSLADQSYVSLKSKEVRDSESPTHDSYNKTIAKQQDQGWKIESSHEQSLDGKLHTSTRTASTSGTQEIEGGKVNFAAKVEEKATVFQDGDDKNFKRAVGTSSSSVIRQEASKCNENSNFQSSTSTTSSSSRYVAESKSVMDNVSSLPSINEDRVKSIVQKTYTSNIPNDLKNHVGYIEGKTKVSQETKTLADGTVVTTTRYETKDGNSTKSSTHKAYSNIAAASSSQHKASSFTDQSGSKVIKCVSVPDSAIDIKISGNIDQQATTAIKKIARESAEYQKESRKTATNVMNSPIDQNIISETRTTKTIISEVPEEYKIRRNENSRKENVEYVEIPLDRFTTITRQSTASEQITKDKADVTHHTSSQSIINKQKESTNVASDQFVTSERKLEESSRKTYESPVKEQTPIYPDKRQPIKPGKSEFDEKPIPTEGQYSTTYRSDFTNKKISVEVSATHDAFARSLRSITPERISKSSLKTTSSSSLRSASSPEKTKLPSRTSPDRASRSRSPKKSFERFSSNETFTYKNYPETLSSTRQVVQDSTSKRSDYCTNTFTRTSKTKNQESVTSDIDTNTFTRKKIKSGSPSSNERSSVSPPKSPTRELTFERPKLLRTDTYEERVKEILGLTKENKEIRKNSLERSSLKKSSFKDSTTRTSSSDDVTKRKTIVSAKQISRTSPEKLPEAPIDKTRKSSLKTKEIRNKISEIPSQIRKSPEKQPVESFPERKSSTKSSTTISEFPSQIRKSPEKEILGPYPERKSPDRVSPTISEFPAQIRRSPERQPLEPYPERKSPTRASPTISEFPAQIRRSPERQPLEPYPERKSPTRASPTISEFPAQIRRSPEKQPLEPYPERKSPTRASPTISEFPAQIRRSPEKQPLEPYPERKSPTRASPTISEFPAQIRRSPERQPLEPYPERKSPTRASPTISEFPAQIRRSPETQVLGSYPERKSPTKTSPTIAEYPSQIRKSSEKKPLESYFEKKSPTTASTTITELPAQARPERPKTESQPEKKTPTKSSPTISEFPAQIGKSPERAPLEPYPERKSPTRAAPTIAEFPAQTRYSPERPKTESHPEKKTPTKSSPTISEFPAQIRKSPEKTPLEPYPERKFPTRTSPIISEFPAQIRKSPEKESSYLDTKSPSRFSPEISEKSKSTKKIKKVKTLSESSTSSEEEIREENVKKTEFITYENRVPISEPIAEKKIFAQLCDADEKRIDKKQSTNDFIEVEILQNKNTQSDKFKETTVKDTEKNRKTLKSSVTTQKDLDINKKNRVKLTDLDSKFVKEKPEKSKTCLKKNIEIIVNTKATKKVPETTIYTTKIVHSKKPSEKICQRNKSKLIGVTEYQDVFSKSKKQKKDEEKKGLTSKKKITLNDIVRLENLTEDKDIHIRTNRVDDTVTRKKVSKTIQINGDSNKPKTCPKITSPAKKSPISVKLPEKSTILRPKHTITTSVQSTTVKKPILEKKIIHNDNKKHIVTATIMVSPKTTSKTKPGKSVCIKTDTKTTLKSKKTELTDSEENSEIESETDFINLTDKRNQFTRTTSDQTFTFGPKEPLRGLSKPDLFSGDTTKTIITTKTVLINNDSGPEREGIVKLQRSKSSREPTPDRLCPRPLTSDEEDDDSLPLRYPDQINEPEDVLLKKKGKKLSEIFESDDKTEEIITEITDLQSKISEVDKVEETDESLLSINKKIHKFLNTAEELTKEPLKPKSVKVERPTVKISEDLENDECLLSVSDKVSKFINTAEQLTTTRLPERSKTEKSNVNIQQKVDQYKASIEESSTPKKSALKQARPDVKTDGCILTGSTQISKSSTSSKSVNLAKVIEPNRRSPSRNKETTNGFIRGEQIHEERTRKSTSSSPERVQTPTSGETTPKRRPSNQYSSILRTETVTNYAVSPETTPKSARRSSQEDNTIVSSVTRLRGNESIRKAKALFENIRKEEATKLQKDVLSRPSVFESRNVIKSEVDTKKRVSEERQTTRKSSLKKVVTEEKSSRSSSPEKVSTTERIEITTYQTQTPEKVTDTSTPSRYEPKSREPSPDGDIPHYMKPLDRSLKPHSPHRENINQDKPQVPTVSQTDTRQTKFGVTLRKTESSSATKFTDNTERRKSSITLEKRITEEEIEEIFDLEVLEELLEKIVGYELRRKVRAQIRLVKKLISEGSLEEYVSRLLKINRDIERRGSSPSKTVKTETFKESTYRNKQSPERNNFDKKTFKHSEKIDRRSSKESTAEYQSSYSTDERRYSSEHKASRESPIRDSLSPQRRVSKTVDVIPGGKVTTTETTEAIPGGIRTTTTRTTEKSFTTLKKVVPPINKTPKEDTQPEWVRQRNLRNIKESTAASSKKVFSSTSSFSKKASQRTSPLKEIKSTDLITSSYGVGPTDENGAPLFGLKALRAQNKKEKTKVQGTIIRSEYYSENDQEPVGQVSVTKYSTDPRDLNQDGVVSSNGKMSSITTTQKFGYKDTPSLKSLSDNKKKICDTTEKSTSEITTINRRGSVKEISKKFIDNAVETLKSERQTIYPKAGLILRSSSFKSTNVEGELDSRESSPEEREIISTKTSVSTMKSTGDTFLSNKNRVTGVQDVLSRMKNEEHVEGDSKEDIAARDLLNKFIGSQVILSGMESCASKSSNNEVVTSSSPVSTVRRTTTITTTITEGGKPTTSTRVFHRPVSAKDLETVWDEESLNLLLEQSTDYEERRIIRIRLREIMAELEETVETTKQVKKEGDLTTTKVTTKFTQQQARAPKPMSPFAKFRQLDKQNSLNKPTPPRTFN
ncbi:hypothetical protein ABEB36_008657 [Hypothenemus hampei]|uniref:Smoothelin domain-containing protein n=1 Tax=Hypothenemus hampei TaxID=57062 RepID=A0ABD1EN78_HYPHA